MFQVRIVFTCYHYSVWPGSLYNQSVDTENLPPSQKGRGYEIRGLGLREFAGLRHDTDPLNPFDLAQYAKLMVVPFDELENLLSPETIDHLLGPGRNAWSGGACSQPLPNGWRLIILNPTHSGKRHKATLMEEVSHVFLGHKPSRLEVKNTNQAGKTIARDYNADIEEEAYSVGAAALVPYTGLKKLIAQGKTSPDIAQHFRVSRELVEFRMKITKLWDNYKAAQT
jgi:hypothetical protein